jgi:hypothetical protein
MGLWKGPGRAAEQDQRFGVKEPMLLPLPPLRFHSQLLSLTARLCFLKQTFERAVSGFGSMPLHFGNPLLSINGGMWTIDGHNGQVWQPYWRANLWRDWGAETTTLFGIDRCR